jgi:RNA polymerase sigma-32 factor
MTSTARVSASTIDPGLKRYIEKIHRIPLLEAGEEFALARRYRERGDRAALERMVNSHLRLVVKIASGYRGYGLPLGELISEGSVGLMQAAERFDADKGFRFATYALWWIRAAIHDYIMRSKSLVRMGTTASQRRLFFSLRRTKSSISVLGDGDMRQTDVERIAARLKVNEQDVVDMNRRLGGDVSLSAAPDDGGRETWQDQLTDDAANQEEILADSEQIADGHAALAEALTLLNERERRIFVSRRLSETPKRLEDIAGEFGVSRERVRQIEATAFLKLRTAITRRMEARDSAPAAAGLRAAA